MAWVRSLRTNGGIPAYERGGTSGRTKVGNLSFWRGVMLAPIRPVASTMQCDLCEDELRSQPTLGEVGGDSLLCPFGWNLRVKEHEHGRASSAERGAEDAGLSGEFLEGGKQRRERRTIGLVDAVFKSRGEQVWAVLREGRE